MLMIEAPVIVILAVLGSLEGDFWPAYILLLWLVCSPWFVATGCQQCKAVCRSGHGFGLGTLSQKCL